MVVGRNDGLPTVGIVAGFGFAVPTLPASVSQYAKPCSQARFLATRYWKTHGNSGKMRIWQWLWLKRRHVSMLVSCGFGLVSRCGLQHHSSGSGSGRSRGGMSAVWQYKRMNIKLLLNIMIAKLGPIAHWYSDLEQAIRMTGRNHMGTCVHKA